MTKNLLTDFVPIERVAEYRCMLLMRKPLCGGTIYELYRKIGYPSAEYYAESGERVYACSCGMSLENAHHAGKVFNVYGTAQAQQEVA